MGNVQEMYIEVDELLNSALPSTIATSFRGTKNNNENQVTEIGRATGEGSGIQNGNGVNPPSRDEAIDWLDAKAGKGVDGRSASRDQAEVDLGDEDEGNGEEDALLPASQERAEKREARNRLALNGEFKRLPLS